MRVTHVINVAEIPGRPLFSGSEQHVFVLMAEQQSRGLQVEFAPQVFRDGPNLQKKFSELQAAGITVAPTLVNGPYHWQTNLRLLPRLLPFFRTRRQRLIHTHLDGVDYAARFAAGLAGCRRVISTVHNNEPHYARRRERLQLQFLDRWNARYIAISECVHRYLVDRLGLPPKKIVTIYYGLPAPAAILTRTEARRRLGLDPDDPRFTVGFIGRFEPQKDPHSLLRAAAEIPELQLVMVGAGSLAVDLLRDAQRLPDGQVHFIPYRPDAADLIPAFDLLCLPSRWEGFGLVLLEAMVRNVPIAGSTAGAIPEILDHGRCGLLFDPSQPSALTTCLRYAMAQRQELSLLAQRAAAWAESRFTTAAMVEQTLTVYREVSGKQKS
ncbi:MAG: glycosyltransferase family 4 protein [bacterium]|nr:glycosyltransferase family 4 protein [bacterium]